MALPSRLMGSGMGAQAAQNICGDTASVTAAGTTATDATQLTAANNNVATVASGTGVKLMPTENGAVVFVRNSGANALKVYPATSSTINGSASITLAVNCGAILYTNSGTAWFSMDTIPAGFTGTAAELNYLDTTAGTGAASKALVLDASGNVSMPDNGAIALSRASVAAAGTTAADATVLADQVNAVTGSNGTVGVALPAAATTVGPIFVINTVLTSGADLKVYPVNGGNDNINGGAEDAAFTMGPGKAAWFIPTSATQWYVEDAAGVLTTTAEANILDGVTATAAELNYNDITTLGTLAASKAWTSDASLDTVMPTGGKLTVQSGGDITLESGSTLDVAGTFEIANVAMTASAAELNYNDITTLGTLAASKAWTSDASLDTVMPTGGLLTVQSGGAVTFNSGSTLTVDGTTASTVAAAEHGAGAIGTAATPKTRRWTDRGVVVTQTTFDLTGLASVATVNDVIGLAAGGAAYIGRNVEATNGVIFKVEFACLETPTGGDNDVNVVANASAVLAYDGAGGTTYLSNSGDLLKGQTIQNLVPALTEGDYFYLTAGTGDTAGTYTAGMYVLTTYGHAALA